MDRPGNRLMEEAFRDWLGPERERFDLDRYPFDAREPIQNIRRFSPKDVGPLPEALESCNFPDGVVTRILEEEGIHAIAWYLPYRIHGEANWGIYFDSFAMNRLAFETATTARLLDPSLKNSEARRVLYASVLRHELEHAIQELMMSTALVSGSITRPQFASKSFARPRSYRESAASHFEHLDELRSISNIERRKVNLVRYVLQEVPAPQEYRAWKSASVFGLDEKFESELGMPLPRGIRTQELRELVGGRASSPYFEVPVYLWQGNARNLALTGTDLRANSLDCKKVKRFLKKGGLTQKLGFDLIVANDPDHDLKIIPFGGGRPIKFACHAWDTVPEMVISEIAAAAGIQKSDLVKELRNHI